MEIKETYENLTNFNLPGFTYVEKESNSNKNIF